VNTTDTDFYRAFANRLRTALTPEGSRTVNDTTTTETVEAPAVPATFKAGGPCEKSWCHTQGVHGDCYGPEVGLASPEGHGLNLLAAYLFYDAEDDETVIVYDRGGDAWRRVGADQLRAEAAKVRAHLARLDLLADQYDAITEAGGTVAPLPSMAGHFPWCAPGECIEHPDHPEWATEHQGVLNVLPETWNHKAEPIGYSRLVHCTDDTDDAGISVTFRGEGNVYEAPQADALIANLERFLTALKAQRAQLGPVDERFCGAHGWCVEHDHGHGSAEAPDCAHESATATLAVPAHHDADREHVPGALLDVSLWAADRSNPTPRALLSIDDDAELPMDADQLEAFADQLAVFRAQVAAKAMQLRQDEATR
jgi:hypothetical protein